MSENETINYETKKETWSGAHLGIYWEACCWLSRGMEKRIWNFYIYIPEKIIPDNLKKVFEVVPKTHKFGERERTYWSYPERMDADVDFHGGITFANKQVNADGSVVYSYGCDYNHCWDEGKTYDHSRVILDARQAVEQIRKAFPELKYWCSGNGNYYSLEEGKFINGMFFSNEYEASKKTDKELP